MCNKCDRFMTCLYAIMNRVVYTGRDSGVGIEHLWGPNRAWK